MCFLLTGNLNKTWTKKDSGARHAQIAAIALARTDASGTF